MGVNKSLGLNYAITKLHCFKMCGIKLRTKTKDLRKARKEGRGWSRREHGHRQRGGRGQDVRRPEPCVEALWGQAVGAPAAPGHRRVLLKLCVGKINLKAVRGATEGKGAERPVEIQRGGWGVGLWMGWTKLHWRRRDLWLTGSEMHVPHPPPGALHLGPQHQKWVTARWTCWTYRRPRSSFSWPPPAASWRELNCWRCPACLVICRHSLCIQRTLES